MPVHYRTCNLCEAMCGLEIDHQDGAIKSIKGDSQDPFSKGYICPKAVALQDIYQDPDRLRKPLKKVNGSWEEISWEAALAEVAERLSSIKKHYGKQALGVYQGNPNVHNLGSMLYNSQLVRALGIRNKFSATSVDQLPHHMASQHMFGHSLLIPIPDIDRTDFFLVLGANPMVSNGSLMTAAGMPKRIRALQERGGKMVVIDPRRSETAQKADEHHFIKPGGDVYLLLGLLKVILDQGLEDAGVITAHSRGLEALRPLITAWEMPELAALCGIEEGAIHSLAQDFARAERAVCYGRLGVSTQQHGSLCQWLINLLNCLTGNFDRAGGALFNKPAVDIVRQLGPKGTMRQFNRWQSKVRGLPEFNGELPVATLAEEILEAGEDGIKAMITIAGNPVLSTPNGQKLDKALASLDYMVAIDIYLNETTRHADIILPPATGLETDHYDLIFNLFAVRNTAKYSPALFAKAAGAMYDWEIVKELITRIRPPKSVLQRWFFNWANPQRLLNLGLLSGPYGLLKGGLSLAKLKKNPHGLDLGALEPQVPKRLFTQDHKIDLAPAIFTSALQALQTNTAQASSASALALINRRHLRSNNSWMHNSERLVKGGDRCTLLMHPADAATRQLADKQLVSISARVGTVEATLQITDEVMPGVVSLPHGWGHQREGVGWQVAAAHPGVSVNDLTDEQLVDPVSGNAAFSGVPVEVAAV